MPIAYYDAYIPNLGLVFALPNDFGTSGVDIDSLYLSTRITTFHNGVIKLTILNAF